MPEKPRVYKITSIDSKHRPGATIRANAPEDWTQKRTLRSDIERAKRGFAHTMERKIGRDVLLATVAGLALGSLTLHAAERGNDGPPVIDVDGAHRVHTFTEGETMWGVVQDAYPLPDNFQSLSEQKQSDISHELQERRNEVRTAEKELFDQQGINLGEIQPGQTMDLPLDAAPSMGPVVGSSE